MKSQKYDIRRPVGARKTYGLTDPACKRVDDPRIDRVNEDLKEGVAIDLLEARMRAIKAEYDKKVEAPAALQNLENERLAQTYLDDHFKTRMLRRPNAYRNDIKRAARACGSLSLYTASQADLQAHINRHHLNRPTKHRRLISGINALLRYLKRGFELAMAEDPESEIAYVALKEFKTKILEVKAPYRAMMGAAFATGARLGELFALEKTPSGMVHVGKQWALPEKEDTKGLQVTPDLINKKAPLKNKKKHYAFVIPELEKWLDEWLAIDEKTKERIRIREYVSKSAYKRCKKVFGLRFHDLRHSYAVHLGTKGFSTAELSQFLGDDERTVRKYYLRFIDDSAAADRYRKLYGGKVGRRVQRKA